MHAGQKAEIVTKLGGKAEMTLLQDSLLSIDLSKRSKMEIRWYDTTGNDTIIALVNTVYAPAGDSRIRFFDTAWKELPASERIRRIRREEFFQFPDSLTKAKKEDLLRPVNIFLVEYNFATDGSLCAGSHGQTIWTKNHSIVSNPICKIRSYCIGTEKDSNKTTSLS